MLPVIAIVGRPNVGKSTLFNKLTASREALVHDFPGVTRDRQYGEGRLGDKPFIVIDTGGLAGEDEGLGAKMAEQAWLAVHEANVVFFVVDAKVGLTSLDSELLNNIRKLNKFVTLVVNKIDGVNLDEIGSEFNYLGFQHVAYIAAVHSKGITQLIEQALAEIPISLEVESVEDNRVRVAIVGRPNVGKSTLINRILGEERVVAYDKPGTTTTSIFIPFDRNGKAYTLIDTAGVRRKSRVEDAVEKFSVIKTLQAIESANVVIVMIDARSGLAEQDLRLIGFVLETGRSLVLVINKWDGLTAYDKKIIKTEIDKRLGFADFARLHYISALHGTGVGLLYDYIDEAYASATLKLSTHAVTELLEAAVAAHQPPLVQGKRIKLRYAHLGGQQPPRIIIHGNQTDKVPESYKRYLINFFRDKLHIVGTPIKVEFKSGENPYEGKKNVLTPRQLKKRRRLQGK